MFIKKEKEFIRLLGPQDRQIEELEGSDELVDVLHRVLLLWKSGKKEEMKKVLEDYGYGKREAFYKVAQAISFSGALPVESREKKLLDGFLSGKDKLLNELKDRGEQRRLF
ncbi:MAG TPA: hypothetical protein EYP29_01825 [Thermoplasmata archaeon]|nr:hypothetical protein [Thermoplasmata archaeon]